MKYLARHYARQGLYTRSGGTSEAAAFVAVIILLALFVWLLS
jgi:hypothetical protein